MSIPNFYVSIFSVAITIFGASTVFSQDFPNKPIRLVAGGVGGSGDAFARIVAQGISGPLGQQVVVANLEVAPLV